MIAPTPARLINRFAVMPSRRHVAKTAWLNSNSRCMRAPARGMASVFRVFLVTACLSLPLLLPAHAALALVIGAAGDVRAVVAPRRPPASGMAVLKAQMNALGGAPENLRRLREFFDRIADSEDAVVVRARQLVASLPSHENAAEAAWRIAAVASLTLASGRLSDLDIDDAYRLAPGALGCDFGAAAAPVHTGFTPISPDVVFQEKLDGPFEPTVTGDSALSDGITAVRSFETSLPNGLYRILIVRDAATDWDAYEFPFGR